MAGSAAGSAGFSATAPSPDSLRFGSSAGASTTFVGEALPSTEVLAFLAATTGCSAAAGAALVFSARAGDDMVCLRRRASMAWWSVDGVATSICALAGTAVRRREEDLLPARETRSKSSAAVRSGCGARVSGGRALRRRAGAPKASFRLRAQTAKSQARRPQRWISRARAAQQRRGAARRALYVCGRAGGGRSKAQDAVRKTSPRSAKHQ